MTLPGVESRLTQPLYDTVQLPAAANPVANFFNIPLGGLLAAGVAKTLADTNLVQGNQLEEGWSFVIKALSMHIRDTAAGGARVTLVDYDLLYNRSFIQFDKSQQWWLRLPTALIPPGPGEFNYFSNIAAAATEYKATKGLGSIGNRFVLDDPIYLKSQEHFQVTLTVAGTPGAVTDVTLVLWGDLTRNVQ